MIERGANPFIQAYSQSGQAWTQLDLWPFISKLSNLPFIKSVYYSVKIFRSGNLDRPWRYTTGVYDGDYGRFLGKGTEGTVIEGNWIGQPAAYKFVPFNINSNCHNSDQHLHELNERLREMTLVQSTPGSAIIENLAHYR